MSRRIGLIAAVLFVATVWFANWLLSRYGVVDIGFGLEAPAGVFAVGIAFTLRDIVHRTLGPGIVIGCIVAGCALAYLVEAGGTIPGGLVPIAVASAVAFLLSELADLSVYTPLQERSFLAAVAASNTVGLVIDSALFLWLAFGTVAGSLMAGQIVGKLYMTALALPLLYAGRRLIPHASVIILAHQAPKTLAAHRHPNLGILCSPRCVYGPDIQEWTWAADNDCFNGGLDEPRYLAMLEKITGRTGCLFVTAPDVVGDADATLELLHHWHPTLREVGQPIALVAQDGLTDPPWHTFDALFVGGTTEWKMSLQAAELVATARRLDMHVHMGRVNSFRRITYAGAIGCQSIDGSQFSWFRDTKLPRSLRHAAGGTQLMLDAQ